MDTARNGRVCWEQCQPWMTFFFFFHPAFANIWSVHSLYYMIYVLHFLFYTLFLCCKSLYVNLFLNVSFVHFFLPFRLYALLRNANSRRRWITGSTEHSGEKHWAHNSPMCWMYNQSFPVWNVTEIQKLEKSHTQLLLMHIMSIQSISISEINIDPRRDKNMTRNVFSHCQ